MIKNRYEGKKEQWKEIKGYEKYEVSDMGRVRNASTGKLRKIQAYSDSEVGTRFITLFDGEGGRKNFTIAQLVASHFINNPNNYEIVGRLDGDRTNNAAENLTWTTRSENIYLRQEYGKENCG